MRRKNSILPILVPFFAFIGLLILVRICRSGESNYLFLVWNLFLAWIPFAVSSLFTGEPGQPKWKQIPALCIWFLFFPNALYIITDLIHLDEDTDIPKWFDAVLLFSASLLGLIMAFISLYRVENLLLRYVQKKRVALIMPALLFTGSFGVYLGRFLRWNSWDIVRNPARLLSEIVQRLIFPLAHTRTWGITVILTLLFYLVYVTIKKLPGYLNREAIILCG